MILPSCAGILGPSSTTTKVIVPTRVPYRIFFTSEPMPNIPVVTAPSMDGKLNINGTTAGAATGIVGGIMQSTPLIWLGGILGLSDVASKGINGGKAITGDSFVAALQQVVGPASQGRKVSLIIEYEEERVKP